MGDNEAAGGEIVFVQRKTRKNNKKMKSKVGKNSVSGADKYNN
jgi:hypothetical protein